MTNQEYEAEISRLTQGYEDLRLTCMEYLEEESLSDHAYGMDRAFNIILNKIIKITGGEK